MHSHHSHSGQYVQHAKDRLEQVIDEAVRCKMEVFCLTEHMPRIKPSHLYPEEIASNTTVEDLAKVFDSYYHHARLLQEQRQNEITLLVGMEAEHIGPGYYTLIEQLHKKYDLDLVVGSIHHVNEIPIDFDVDLWMKALESTGGSAQKYFERYFDDQYEMLQNVKPQVVGHFDLILLFARQENCGDFDISDLKKNKPVWDRIVRNIVYAKSIGAMIEINSAAIRKGWDSPYPKLDILKAILDNEGEVCLSDDSHGVAQVALNYHRSLEYLQQAGVSRVHYLTRDGTKVVKKSIPLDELVKNWTYPNK
ncbi:hypothetical protein TRVA0_082S00188 [Trichomonascus vanleenenianus]|uniref:histidinol-phosphatase n=1 Tax=Trichomonascus vanleenenianus TaxID=2268995 RepID=UPI003ECAB186